MAMALQELQRAAGAAFMNYGPPPEEGGAEVVEHFGQYEAEYAAIRQRVGIMHQPQRAVIELTGADRAEFLHHLLANDVTGLQAGAGRRAFLLSEKGRVLADVFILQHASRMQIELDRLDKDELLRVLDSRLFAEDVTLHDASDQYQPLALHGPAAASLLDAAGAGDVTGLSSLAHRTVTIEGAECTVYRRDDAGALGLHVLVPTAQAESVYRALLQAAGFDAQAELEPDADYAQRRRESLRGRPIGWRAYNTARIEAGTPIFHIDFGQDSLPAETGVLDEAVSFEKGCYIGQEVVARMRNLGHPKRILVGLKCPDDRLPVAGAQVFTPDVADGSAAASDQVVGGITSSTLSPLLGQCAIAFAVVKWGQHEPGTRLAASVNGQTTEARVQSLRFLDSA